MKEHSKKGWILGPREWRPIQNSYMVLHALAREKGNKKWAEVRLLKASDDRSESKPSEQQDASANPTREVAWRVKKEDKTHVEGA